MEKHENKKKLKYEDYFTPLPTGLDAEVVSKAYNNSNSRFWNAASNKQAAVSFSRKKRELGWTMVEAMVELGWKWKHGGLAGNFEEFAEHMRVHFGLKYLPAFHEYRPARGGNRGRSKAAAPSGVEPGGFYHRKYPWVASVEEEEEEEGEEGEEEEEEDEEEEEEDKEEEEEDKEEEEEDEEDEDEDEEDEEDGEEGGEDGEEEEEEKEKDGE